MIAPVDVPDGQSYGALTFDGDKVTNDSEESSAEDRGYVSLDFSI